MLKREVDEIKKETPRSSESVLPGLWIHLAAAKCQPAKGTRH
jgi:hypothetical protein